MLSRIHFLHEILLNLLISCRKNKVSYHVFLLLLLVHEVYIENQEPRIEKSDWFNYALTVADLGGDPGLPGVQRNPPFLAKMNLAHGGVCSLSRGYYYNNVCREARQSIFRRVNSTLRGKFAPRRNSSKEA